MNSRVKADPDLDQTAPMRRRTPVRNDETHDRRRRIFRPEASRVLPCEPALSVLAYNIIRAINLAGAETLRARLA